MTRLLETLRPLAPYVARYRASILAGLFLVVANGAVSVVAPLVLKVTIDGLQADLRGSTLLWYAGLILAFALLKGLFSYAMRWSVMGLSRHLEYDLRQDLFERVIRLSPSYFDRVMTGDLMARATSDLNSVRMMLGPGFMYAVSTVVLLLATLAMMLSVDPRLTAVALAPLPVVSLASWFFGGRIHERYKKAQEAFADVSTRVQENLAGVRVVRAFSQEAAEITAFRTLSEQYLDKNLGLIRLWGLFYPSLELLMGLSFLCILWMGGLEVAAGRISLGTFVAFNAYVAMLAWPMNSLGWVVNLFQRGTASMVRLNEIMDELPEIRDGAGQTRELRGELEFRHLDFSYGPQGPVLRDVNLHVRPGETVGIIGPTGSGKTTLVSLIPRLYDAQPGTLLVDGTPVHDLPIGSLRSQIGFVPQDTMLFSDTLRANVALGRIEATDEQVAEAVAVAGLSADLEGFPEGLETRVGERGITLSGGQKQRTALARAVLRDPRILVLDDALSSVDTQTEARILERLAAIMKGRTTLLISHRISTVRLADRIVVLEAGRITEEGTHDALVARGGLYADLHRRQRLEQELEEMGDDA